MKIISEVGDGSSIIVLKSDQEPSIKELIRGVRRERPEKIEEVIPEESPVGEHQCNGMVERAIQSINGQAKTLKLSLEERYKGKIGQEHHIWPWVIQYAAMLINICHVHEDGRTAYEKKTKRKKGENGRRCCQR